tara:strand:- start:71 stop:937 length:867 start_codon:yes stop_codon:yes gene_type:complete
MSLIFDKYEIEKHIGTGSFGDVFVVRNVATNEKLACKLEINSKVATLKHEANILQYLNKVSFVPKLRRFGYYNEKVCMIMDLYNESLETIKERYGKFSTKDAIILMHDLLGKIKVMHKMKIIHRDIKPENFLLCRQSNDIKIIDFGLSKKYVSKGKHIEYKTGKNIVGTSRYISINVHNGIEASRRDDLISLGYMLIWLQRSRLPWQGIKHSDETIRLNQVKRLKCVITVKDLCKNIESNVFTDYLNAVMKLKFDEEPDYDALIRMFLQELRRNGWFSSNYDFINSSV